MRMLTAETKGKLKIERSKCLNNHGIWFGFADAQRAKALAMFQTDL
jgi:hypothetical protein